MPRQCDTPSNCGWVSNEHSLVVVKTSSECVILTRRRCCDGCSRETLKNSILAVHYTV
jgi:hypothetical protein